jgi:hypothetical protein
VSATGNVKMRPDSAYTYDQLVDAKYTDEQIIAGGFADPDFTK